MDWRFLVGLFAKPLGAAINNGIQAASAATVAWAVHKGADAGMVAPIVASIAGAASLAISALATSQGVQIPIINDDTTNNVKVVRADAPAPAVNGPLYHGGPKS